MQISYPDYYGEFSCTADKCPDTCCAGWGIVIDEKTRRKYSRVRGSFGRRLLSEIDWWEQSFRQKEGRCAFLNCQNLCDIYQELGEGYLCDTCRKYPRHIEEFENIREISLSLSCPAAAGLILGREEKVRFVTKEKSGREETYEGFDFFLFDKLVSAREYMLEVLQNREKPIEFRLGTVLGFVHDLQGRIRRKEVFAIDEILEKYRSPKAEQGIGRRLNVWCRRGRERSKILREMAESLKALEVLDPNFREEIQEYEEILGSQGNIRYQTGCRAFREACPWQDLILEQLMVYFVFTYFCGGVYDEAPYAKLKMALTGSLLIREWMMARWLKQERYLELKQVVEISYRFSRELEHSDRNLNTMEKMMTEQPLFSMDHFLTVIMN